MSGTTGIGDSTCVMLARVTFTIVESAGAPVAGAEIWSVDESDAVPPLPTRAQRWGRSDVAGRFVTTHCYAGGDDVSAWQREAHPTRLSFLVLHDALGVRRAIVEPPLTDVYSEGDIRTSRLGRAVNYGYELAVRITY